MCQPLGYGPSRGPSMATDEASGQPVVAPENLLIRIIIRPVDLDVSDMALPFSLALSLEVLSDSNRE
jgi:hypothetical protein